MANTILEQGRKTMQSKFGTPTMVAPRDENQPAPPLSKAPMQANSIPLPDFNQPLQQENYMQLLQDRRSRRAFSDTPLTLEQLSFLLFSTQGVQRTVGKTVTRTLRPVPSGGGRHPFETYLALQNVQGLQPGIYHYLPLEHRLEFLKTIDYQTEMSANLNGQTWAAMAPVVFMWAAVPARCEWAYTESAPKLMLLDAGHIAQNLQLSAVALGLGSCCIASYCQQNCDEMLGLDGDEEFMVYAAAVGVCK